MARIELPSRAEMTPEQQQVHDTVVSGPRGVIIGPLRAAIHSPELARRWSALGEVLRYGTTLPKRLTELAILVTGRRWARTPAIVTQLLLLPVVYSLIGPSRQLLLGLLTGAVVFTAFMLLISERSRAWSMGADTSDGR